MSSLKSPHLDLELKPSRYPRRLRLLAVGLMTVSVWLTPLSGWLQAGLWLLGLVLLLRWRLPQLVRVRLFEQQLTVWQDNGRSQVLEAPYRVLRQDPWLAFRCRSGNPLASGAWLHLFADQASESHLQPLYQWLWLNR